MSNDRRSEPLRPESSSEEQLDQFLNLLAALKVVDSDKQTSDPEIAQSNQNSLESGGRTVDSNADTVGQAAPAIIVPHVGSALPEEVADKMQHGMSGPVSSPLAADEPLADFRSLAVSKPSTPPDPGPEADSIALEQLQALLMGPDLLELQHKIAGLKQSLSHLEYQLLDPDAFIQLLLPAIAQVLSRKTAEAKEEMVQAMAPIIDDLIRNRAEQDLQSMSAALSQVIPAAIAQEIRNSPKAMATAIAPEIALALMEQTRLNQDAIPEALGPGMGAAIKQQIRLERDAMVEALYPVIGGTISRYLKEVVQSINQQVEAALSVQGIRRKLRAKLHGVSEAELILSEAMPFAVQAVFLIHKRTGLVMAEVQPAELHRLDSDMVAGMLTAIRSFVSEYIVQPGEVAELDQIEYGNSQIILEVAGYCYLAVVTRQQPPPAFVQQARHVLSELVQHYSKPLKEFAGDPSTIPVEVQTRLTTLLVENTDHADGSATTKRPVALVLVGLLLLGAVAVPWGWHYYRDRREQQVEEQVAQAWANHPDLSVYRLDVEAARQTLTLTGRLPNPILSQKAERLVKEVAPGWQLRNEIQTVSLPPNPQAVAAEVQRAVAITNQMKGVSVTANYQFGTVILNGQISKNLNPQTIAQIFEDIPGVQSVISTFIATDFPAKLPTINMRLYFEPGSATVQPNDSQTKLAVVRQILEQYPTVNLKIIGHSQSTDAIVESPQLAQQRAEVVKRELVQLGVSNQRLQTMAASQDAIKTQPNQPLWLNHYVEFQPILAQP